MSLTFYCRTVNEKSIMLEAVMFASERMAVYCLLLR